jgi:hypothetical protein
MAKASGRQKRDRGVGRGNARPANQVYGRRNPRTKATVNQLLGKYHFILYGALRRAVR